MQQGVKTSTRQKVLNYIRLYEKRHGYCPTVREIGSAVGLKSTSSVYGHLQRLQHDGLITTKKRCPRTISADGKRPVENAVPTASSDGTYYRCGFRIPSNAKVITVVATLLDSNGEPLSVQAHDVAGMNRGGNNE